MFWRMTCLVACAATLGGWVLTLRHNRVQALSELTQAQLRINRQDERLWHLRTLIAARITPPEVERLCADLGPLTPILPYTPTGAATFALGPTDPPGDAKVVPTKQNTPPTLGGGGAASKPTPKSTPSAATRKATPPAKPPAKRDAAKPPAREPKRLATGQNPRG